METIGELTKYFNSMTPEEIERHDIEILAQIADQERRDALERYKKSGVPERYWNETLDTYKTESEIQLNAHKCAIAYTTAIQRGEFKSFVMIGNAGTGKTHLACGILREYGWGLYRTAPDIVEELRRAKSFTALETEAQINKRLSSARKEISMADGLYNYVVYNYNLDNTIDVVEAIYFAEQRKREIMTLEREGD